VLGLLAIKPWSSYELTIQMERSLGLFWPRTVSKLYEEPKKLVDHGLARSSTEQNGQRSRTVYAITAKGRRALAKWLQEPGAGPVLEFEQLLKVFFAENATRADALNTLHAAQQWARDRCADSLSVGETYLGGQGLFPQRLPELQLTSRFLTDFYLLVLDWARWAAGVVERWPDDPKQAQHDPTELAETIERARQGALSDIQAPSV
jgi:DNA-binding PadR family transcriptional regulator